MLFDLKKKLKFIIKWEIYILPNYCWGFSPEDDLSYNKVSIFSREKKNTPKRNNKGVQVPKINNVLLTYASEKYYNRKIGNSCIRINNIPQNIPKGNLHKSKGDGAVRQYVE